ncbi:hypothetical protein [Sphingomonas sp. BK345]|uniref:hypothetical protein n=1 Tax=Sphingomonas sp. BK345 TaxID=2586980 RepID=UPI001615FCDC|nr:hypothetical protein [Sphingomonas sp. BK345]MBB3475172.1 hypothetical protein [Sphingomonas sp. BK345]
MDLIELHRRQQISVGMAAAAVTPEARSSHSRLASGYAARIKNYDASAEERFSAIRANEHVASLRADHAGKLIANENAAGASPTA